uniref:CSON010622 protein n=1 Tax=Culicoides sonorensis TaxID=179676 RepID=A0A336MZS0_CULSO
MKLVTLKIFFLIFLVNGIMSSNFIQNSLIFQYFTEIHPVKHVLIFSTKSVDLYSLQNFMSNGISILQVKNNTSRFEEFFHPVNTPVGVYVESGHDILQWASNEKYFNSSYFWLIEGNDLETAESVLGNLFHIQLNSQITFIEKFNSKLWNLIDVYSYGRHLRYELVMNKFAEWNAIEEKMMIVKEFPLMYRKSYRGNFNGLVMRQGIVIAKRPKDHSIEYFDKIMTEPGTSQDILTLVKYQHNQGMILRQRYNFSVRVNRIATDITTAWIKGKRGGGLGILARNETDVSSTGGLVTPCRLEEFDFIHTRFFTKADYFYRLSPELIGKGEKQLTFLVPFNNQVWICILVTLILITILLKLYSKKLYDHIIKYESIVIQVVSIVTSQGLDLPYNHIFRRITTFTGQLLVIMILNLYAGKLLTVLLTPVKDPFQDRTDLLNSDIHLGRYTTWGIARQLETSNRPDYNELFFNTSRGLSSKSLDKKTIAVFDNYYEGLQYMKNNPVTFTGESSNIQGIIKRTFSPDEICEVKKQVLIHTPQYYALKKHSQYSRAFMIGLLKADEAGILQKLKNTYFEEMPPCVAGVKLYSVPFGKIKSALIILSVAACLSIIIFVLEYLWFKMSGISLKFIEKRKTIKKNIKNVQKPKKIKQPRMYP